MRLKKIAQKLNTSPAFLSHILSGRRPGYKYLLQLSQELEIDVKAFLNPKIFFNPYMPFYYKNFYPPSLSHLSGEALELAKQIISAFPDRPPTKEEFKEFKRKLRKTKNNGGQ